MAIPFFILAGDLMTAGGISRRLVGFADVLVRHRTGGLGMVAVLAAAFFAALSGSAPATTAAIGAIMIPEMEKRGYSRAFATALAVAGGIIGPMLPPSIPMVVWGVMSETSISDLFLAGILPGILLALGLMVLCWHHARKHKIAAQPKAKDIGFSGQWLQVRPIERRKQIRPACPIIAHDTHVQCVQQRPDGGIQLCQREEPVIAQPRIVPQARLRHDDPALGNLNGHLDLGFIFGFAHARWQDRRTVMFRHFGIGPVQAGIIPVCLDHG